MRFEFYTPELENVPKLSVDGTVPNSIHFSHWQGNETPAELKADTSTEIALNLVASPNQQQLTHGIELVTNNHFDTDGVLSVWTMLKGERALDLRDKFVPAAESGDFSEFRNESAVRASIVIQGTDQPVPDDDPGSPIASRLAGEVVENEARAYELVLPEVERILTHTDDYEELWRGPWRRIERALDTFERGTSSVTEFPDLSLVFLAPEAFGDSGFIPGGHSIPFTAIAHHAKGPLFLITTPVSNGYAYRIDYPYYSWAETVVRPRIRRRDLSDNLAQLNQSEKSGQGEWTFDTTELTAAIKFLADDGKLAGSTIRPDEVAAVLQTSARAEPAAASV